MITAAVQQSSQIVEAQGAPPASQNSDDDFRATFAASLDTSSSSAFGTSEHADATPAPVQNSKQVQVPQPFLKNPAIGVKIVPPHIPATKPSVSTTVAPEAVEDSEAGLSSTPTLHATLASQSLQPSKAGSDATPDLETAFNSASAVTAGDSRSLLNARVHTPIVSPLEESATTVPPGITAAGKDVDRSKSATGALATRSKDETSGSDGELVTGGATVGVAPLAENLSIAALAVLDPAGSSVKALSKEAEKSVAGVGTAGKTIGTSQATQAQASLPTSTDVAPFATGDAAPLTESLQLAFPKLAFAQLADGKTGQVAAGAQASSAARPAVAAAKSEKPKPVEASTQEETPAASALDVSAPGAVPHDVQSVPAIAASSGLALATAAPVTVHPGVASGLSVHADGSGAVAARASGSGGIGSASAGSLAVSSTTSASPISEPHQTLLATPTALEVGVQSGTQGWLRIRAEVGDQGQVTASLAAASTGGRELLHSQIPALNAFLHSEQIAVSATVSGRGDSSSGGSQGGGSLQSGAGTQNGGGDGNASPGQNQGAQAELPARTTSAQSTSAQSTSAQSSSSQSTSSQPSGAIDALSTYDALTGAVQAVGSSSSGTNFEVSGRWLNVRV